MTIAEKAAYLKGLTDGLGFDPQSKEGRLWAALNDLLGDMAHEIEGLHETDRGQAQALDGVADELSYLEELCGGFDSEDEEDEPAACGSCPRPCMTENYTGEEAPAAAASDSRATQYDADDELKKFAVDDDDPYRAAVAAAANAVDDSGDDELQYDGVVYDATCPVCGEEISFDEQTLEKGSIQCPKCGEILEFELGEDDDADKPADDAAKA